MAKFIYVCDCGVEIEGRDEGAIKDHEATCPIANQASALEDIKEMVAYFTERNVTSIEVDTISKMFLKLDLDLQDFYDETIPPGALASLVAVKLLDINHSLNERLVKIESMLEVESPTTLEPITVDNIHRIVPNSTSNNEDDMSVKLFKASQDTLTDEQIEEIEEDEALEVIDQEVEQEKE